MYTRTIRQIAHFDYHQFLKTWGCASVSNLGDHKSTYQTLNFTLETNHRISSGPEPVERRTILILYCGSWVLTWRILWPMVNFLVEWFTCKNYALLKINRTGEFWLEINTNHWSSGFGSFKVPGPSPDVLPGFFPMIFQICKAEGQVQLLRELLKRNACCAQREPISGCTALHLAARNGEEVPFGSIWLDVEVTGGAQDEGNVRNSKKVMLCRYVHFPKLDMLQGSGRLLSQASNLMESFLGQSLSPLAHSGSLGP